LDYSLQQWINAPAGSHPLVDSVMRHTASWGEAIFIGIVALWFLLGWRRGLPRERQGALAALLAAGAALLLNMVISHLWTRPRPFVTHPDTVHVLLRHSVDASFPSDHAAAGFAVAGVVFVMHRRLGTLALLLAAGMSYARVYAGDHYPGDVLAGAVVGLGVATVLTSQLDPLLLLLRQFVDRLITWLRLPLPASVDR